MENEKIKYILDLSKKAAEIINTISAYRNTVAELEQQIKSMLPKGYFYTYDIDTNWNHPKKYSIKNVSCTSSGDVYLTIKEVFKKKPWPGFTGEHHFYLESFCALSIHKTEQAAIDDHMNRPCPKCGKPMKNATTTWCASCMQERKKIADEFKASHYFYSKKNSRIVHLEYEDEITHWRSKGWDGKSFTIRRLDTGEILQTTNLWSDGFGPNVNNYPEIEFVNE